jgi:type I restriction enzyme, S subunit
MSKLEELIAALCPDGVEYKCIGDVANCYPGATPKTSKPEYWENGTIAWMSSGEVNYGEVTFTEKKITQLGYDNSSTKMVPANTVVIALAGQGKTRGTVAITRIPLCTNQSLCAIVTKENILSEFLLHFLRSQYQQLRDVSSGDGTRGGLNLKMINAYKVPVPPLPVQSEIVSILDKFTELTAELTARKKQYEYYKVKLFTGANEIQMVTLDMVSENCDAQRRPVTSGNRETGNIPYYGASGIVDYVKDYIYDGDYLLISEDGANLLARTTPIAFSVSGKIRVNNHAHVLKFEEYATRRYVEMYLNSIDLSYYITGAAQPKLNQKNLNKIEIPLPSLAEQQRIVDILDRFDTLCNDISTGLPAEIEARTKQYEYYRDKLLTFKELS